MHFDELLKIVGEIGLYQKIRLGLICLVALLCAFHAMNMVYVGANPKKACIIPDNNVTANVSIGEWKQFLQSSDRSKCEIYDEMDIFEYIEKENYTFSELKKLVDKGDLSLKRAKCNQWRYDDDVYGSTIVTQFNLVCDRAWLRSTSKTLYFFGRLIGAVTFGQLADIFGRRIMFFVGILMLLIVGCAAAASSSMYMFIPFYILQGAAQTGLFLVAYTMCTEMVGPKFRIVAGFMVNVSYSLGYMILPGLAYGLRDWRLIEVVITVPAVLFASYLCVLHESVRWLLSKNRTEEAKKIIKRVAATNGAKLSDEALDQLQTDNKTMEVSDRTYTFVDLFRPWRMLILSLNIFFNWLVNSMVFYGINLGTDSSRLGGDPYINFMIAGGVQIPSGVLLLITLNRFGRKKLLLCMMALAGISCIAAAFIPNDKAIAKISMTMVGKFGISTSYSIIYLMSAEVFPTVVRNVGIGTASMTARIGGMVAPQIWELSNFWTPLPMLVFGGMAILAGFFALFLPETTGKSLPQTIDDLYRDTLANGSSKKRSQRQEHKL